MTQAAANEPFKTRGNGRVSGDGSSDLTAPVSWRAGSAFAACADAAELAGIEAEWRDLAESAIEANPFYGPALLLPALDAFSADQPETVTVRDAGGRLIGLAPIAPLKGYSRLPIPYIATWMHKHCYFAAPLVRAGSEHAFFRSFFDFAERRGAFLRLRHMDAEGPLVAAASAVAAETSRRVSPSARYERAMLPGGWRTEAYLADSLSGKKRKELRRQRARLSEIAPVRFEKISGVPDLDLWTEQFLALEAAGWKGREDTALASDSASAAFFRAIVKRAGAEGELHLCRLIAGDSPAAMAVNFISRFSGGEAVYAFKIAYDEALARFSPGVALEIEMMGDLEQRRSVAYIDSCAQAGHPMINRLWRDRRRIAALNISRRDASSKALFRVLMMLESVSEKARARKAARMEPEADGDL